jgi:T4-like virus tail tube protein gp19
VVGDDRSALSEVDSLLPVRNFRVFLGRREVGFCHVEGLVSEAVPNDDATELLDGTRPLVLRRALGTDRVLFEWRERAASGRRYPRDVALDQYDDRGVQCVNTFVFEGAWPVRWSGPVFEATSDGIALEELELSYERLIWMEQPGSRPAEQSKSRPRGRDGRTT